VVKPTIDVDVNTSAINSLIELVEKYRSALEEANKLLKQNFEYTKQTVDAQKDLNRSAERRTYTPRQPKEDPTAPIWTTQDRGPTVEKDPKTGQFRRYSGTSWKWSAPKDSGSTGQFQTAWAAPPPKGSLSDLDRLAWGAAKDSGSTGRFKAEEIKATRSIEKLLKSNDKWSETFYQMFQSGRFGQNILRGILSGNFAKMLGGFGALGAAGAAVQSLAATGADQRLRAQYIGGDIGKMRSAEIELARFGPVRPGLEAARTAKSMIGPEFAAYTFMGFTEKELRSMDPADLYAELLVRAQKKLKGLTPQAMGNIFEAQGLGTVLPGGIGQATQLIGMSPEETAQAKEAVRVNAKYLESTDAQMKALTDLTATFNLAGTAIQTHFMNKLAELAPAIDSFIKNQLHMVFEGPEAKPITKENLGKESIWKDLFGPESSVGKLLSDPHIWGPPAKEPTFHEPRNNPPLESSIQDSAAIAESDGGVFGGMTRVGIFTPKIEKLNKEVVDTTKSLNEFNEQLKTGFNILSGRRYEEGGTPLIYMRGTRALPGFGTSGIGPSGLGPGTGGVGGGADIGGGVTTGNGTTTKDYVPGTSGIGPSGLGPGTGGVGGGAVPGISGGVKGGGIGGATATKTPGADIAASTAVDEAIRSTAKSAGMDPAHWKAIAGIESSFDPNVVNQYGYGGLYQMGKKEWATYGEGKNIRDPQANAEAAARLATHNIELFRKAKGRDPNADEIYLMHQQGPEFYTDPGSIPARHLMTNIPKGSSLAKLGRVPTLSEFETYWSQRVEQGAAKYAKPGTSGQFAGAGGSSGGGGATGSFDSNIAPNVAFGATNITKTTGYGGELGKMTGLRAENPKDREKINAYLREAGVQPPYDSATIAWCAAMVNAELAHEGVRGTGALSVESFKEWGRAEKASQAQIGDIMITKSGSHVGRFEGMDPKTGLAKFYAGNEADPEETTKPPGLPGYPRRQWGRVNEREVDPNQFEFRGRSEDTSTKSHIGDMSMYQQNPGVRLHVNNPAGMDIVAQSAMLGTGQGNYG
jgi:hypothetical protein